MSSTPDFGRDRWPHRYYVRDPQGDWVRDREDRPIVFGGQEAESLAAKALGEPKGSRAVEIPIEAWPITWGIRVYADGQPSTWAAEPDTGTIRAFASRRVAEAQAEILSDPNPRVRFEVQPF